MHKTRSRMKSKTTKINKFQEVTMKKLFAILIACLLVLMSGCSKGAKEAEKAKIGVVVPDLNNSFCIAMDQGVTRAAKEKGYEVFEYVTEMNPENDVASVEQLANNNVKAYYGLHMVTESVGDRLKNEYPDIGCFSQVNFDGAAQVLNDDFTVVAQQFTESLDAFLAENNITEAEICGLWLGSAQIEGTTENIQYQAIMDGINEHYANTGIKYVQSEYPADSEAVANTIETLLLAHPNATVFFCHNNDYAISAANTIMAAKTDTSSYFIFSTETDDETMRQIADPNSPYRGASATDTEETGYQIGLQCVNWIENGKMDPVPLTRELVDFLQENENIDFKING